MGDEMGERQLKNIKKASILVIIIALSVSVFLNIRNYNKKANQVLMSETIDEQIMNISEISTVKYNYTDVISYENSRELSGLKLPFTKKRFLVKYSGYMKSGFDFTSAEIEVKAEDKVSIILPKAVILDNVIMEEKVAFFDEKSGLFNPLEYKDLYDVLIDEKAKKAEEAIENGILQEAEQNLEEVISLYLLELGFEEVNIKFKNL